MLLTEARAELLRSLQLSWDGLRVLEVGSGPGLLAESLVEQGADVVCVDGRGDVLDVARRRIPGLQTAQLDVQQDPLLPLGRFDVVVAFSLLNHLAEPLRALRNVVSTCEEILIVDTVTLDHSWIAMALEQIGMSAVYGVADEGVRRTFVAARHRLDSPNLVAITQIALPRPAKVVLDVGAHLGETTMSLAESDPTVVVYAFEPLPGYAEALNRRLPNYHAWPIAIAGEDGEAELHINSWLPASSLRSMRPDVAATYPVELSVEHDALVPTRRLDTFCREHHIGHVNWLKIDTQGADLEVLESLGPQLAMVDRGVVEAQHAGGDLYEGTPGRTAVRAFLERSGFRISGELLHTDGRETNIYFERVSSPATRVIAVGWESAEPSGEAQLVARPDSLGIVTPPEPWSYAALIPLPSAGSVPRAVRATLEVHEGRVGFGLLRSISDIAVEFSLDAGQVSTFDLPVLAPHDIWRFLVRNHSIPLASRCTITKLALVVDEP